MIGDNKCTKGEGERRERGGREGGRRERREGGRREKGERKQDGSALKSRGKECP